MHSRLRRSASPVPTMDLLRYRLMSETRQSMRKDNTKLIITLGFGAVLALMFVLVFIAVTQLQSVNKHISTLVEETYAKTEAAHTMREAIRMRASTLNAMRLADDAFERDEHFMRLARYAGMYREARNLLLTKGMTNSEKDIHSRLNEAARQAQPVNDYAAELLTSEVSADEARAAVAQAAAEQAVLLDLLNELVALERSNANQALKHSRTHYREARNAMFLLAGTALVLGMLIAFLVIRQASARNRQISYHASHDTLTGLANRHELECRIQEAVHTARHDGVEHALLYMDLDQFKLVNDTCGHVAGDELLRQLTRLLKQRQRRTDTFGRLGGDEFALLLENCPLKKATQIAEILRQNVESFRFSWEGKTFTVSASIGVVPISDGEKSLEHILCTADTACYMAKQSGRNRVHVAGHNDRDIANHRCEVEFANKIRESLQQDRFELHCQRIVPTQASAHAAQHIEILLRMRDKHGGLIPPGAFIPAAERYNLMPAIDRWVVEHAVSWLAGQPRRRELPTLMINLSGQSLCNDKFLRFVLASLENSNVPAHKLCFEITETSAVANLARAREFIDSLKRLGCSFALDDFGSGFSSFSYLKSLPVDYLKIDGAFVREMVENPIDFAMVKAINEIGQALQKRTIAEFVENKAILDKLKSLGVDFAQGYGIARPEPLDSLARETALPEDGALLAT
jgi:diguanylate cyclase (GGDEF)-like protein